MSTDESSAPIFGEEDTSTAERPANWQRFTVHPSQQVAAPAAVTSEPAEPEPTFEFADGFLNLAFRLTTPDFTPEMMALAPKVTRLDIGGNGLSALPRGLAAFSNLRHLVVDNNELEELDLPSSLTNLSVVWANRNNIRDVLGTFRKIGAVCGNTISQLSIVQNPGSPAPDLAEEEVALNEYRRFRIAAVSVMKNLRVLDGFPVTQAERDEAPKRGAFYLGAKRAVGANTAVAECEKNGSGRGYGKLDDEAGAVIDDLDAERVGRTRTFLGEARNEYTGKCSEGNRFIRDREL